MANYHNDLYGIGDSAAQRPFLIQLKRPDILGYEYGYAVYQCLELALLFISHSN